MMHKFKASIDIKGVNPYVYVPEQILKEIYVLAGRDKCYIPVCVVIDKNNHKQTLVKYCGDWRLYINTSMLKNSPKRIGEIIDIAIELFELGKWKTKNIVKLH